jgi:hypothetical protein
MEKDLLKKYLKLSVLPLLFLFWFLLYFTAVSYNIYSAFGYSILGLLLRLPCIFFETYLHFFLFTIFLSFLTVFRRLFIILFPIFTFILSAVYIIQYFSLYYMNRYIVPEAYFHFEDAHLLFSNSLYIIVMVSMGGLVFVSMLLAGRLAAPAPREGQWKLLANTGKQACLAAAIFAALAVPGFGATDRERLIGLYGPPQETPHNAFFSVVRTLWFAEEVQKRPELPPDLQSWLARQFGITYRMDQEYPMVKDWIWKTPLPFQPKGDSKGLPNIILFLIESLCDSYMEAGTSRNLIPNMNAFAKNAMNVAGYYNHTFPTINGIRGQLCSYYPFLGETDYSNQGLVNIKLRGLPEILNQKGYETVFFSYFADVYSPNPNHEINIKKLLQECGFSSLRMARDIQKSLVGEEGLRQLGENVKPSVNDLGMMTAIKQFLKEREDNPRPFMISTITLGTHININTSKEEILNMLVSFDKAFGLFWDYFKNSPYADNTIVVLTGDHAMPPIVGYRELIGNNRIALFDKLVCLIYDPQHDMPARFVTLSSSLDIAPSILHLAGINDVANAFQGLSLFSDRVEHPGVLCTTLDRIYMKNPATYLEIPVLENPNALQEYLDAGGDVKTDTEKQMLGLRLWYTFNFYLNTENRIWNDLFSCE